MHAVVATVLRRAPRRLAGPRLRHAAAALGAFALLAVAGSSCRSGCSFLVDDGGRRTACVSLGIVVLMRGGVVPFGQGMVFASAATPRRCCRQALGITDALGLALLGVLAAADRRRRSRRCWRATAASSSRC